MLCDPAFAEIAEVWHHRYELLARAKLSSVAASTRRQGALLKVIGQDGATGYADCHPWVEFGDATLAQQLELLSRKTTTPLTQRSLAFAKLDATARTHSTSLFASLQIPPSHYLALNIEELRREKLEELASAGFTHVKCKASPDLAARIAPHELASWLAAIKLKLRLDFNATLSTSQLDALLIAVQPMLDVIDFIEDPCVYDAGAWKSARARHGVRLAIDRVAPLNAIDPDSVDVVILKPAVDTPNGHIDFARRTGRRLCVTSYMDHPVGQLGAAYTAAKLAHDYPLSIDVCGLLTHVNYQGHHFVACLSAQGPFLEAPAGTGIGFDDLLEDLIWRRLA